MKTLRTFLPILSFFLLASPAVAGEFPLKIEETILDNGLKVVVVRRPGVPQAACALGVKAGSVCERPGYTGTAHFLEHMMFKGTDKIGVQDPAKDRDLRRKIDDVVARIRALEEAGEEGDRLAALKEKRDALFEEQKENLELNHIFKIYSGAGGVMTNAFTSYDMTCYFSLLPPEKIELFFWIESERFQNPVFRQFHAEKAVVREERRLSENRPGAAFYETLHRTIFGSHAYAHPILGTHEDVRSLTRWDLRRFFDTWYTPDNMFLVVAGDVEAAEVFALARKYFGALKAYEGERPRIPTAAPCGSLRVYGKGSEQPLLTVSHVAPPAGSDEEVALDLIALHLGDEEGALRRVLVREKEIATDVSAFYDARKHAGLMGITVEMKPGHAPEEAEADILKAVRRLIDAPLAREEVEAAARKYRAGILGSLKNEMRFGFLFIQREVVGSWRDIEDLLRKAKEITPDDIQRVARETLVEGNRTVGVCTVEEGAASTPPPPAPEPKPEASKKPGIAPSWKDLEFEAKPFAIPDPDRYRFTLSNGIRVVAVPDPYDPTFRIEALLEGGSRRDPGGKEGMASLLAAVANRSGIPGLSRKAVKEKLEALVGDYHVLAMEDCLSFSLSTFKKDRKEGLDFFKALLLYTALDGEVLEPERERLKSNRRSVDMDPRALCDLAFTELLWGDVSETRRSTLESLDAITLEDLEAFLEAHRDPRRAVIAVSGDFTRAEIRRRLEDAFGRWQAPSGPLGEAYADSPGTPGTGLHLMDFDASQGYVKIGAPSVPKGDEDIAAVKCLASVLSRRIFNRIRSVEGLAYQAGARNHDHWKHAGLFAVIFQTKAPSVPFAISLALEEIETIRREPPTAEEMDNATRRFEARYQTMLGRKSDLAATFARLVMDPHADPRWYARFAAAVKKLTPEDVRNAARTYLDPDGLLIVCVGKRDAMAPGDGEHPQTLADFGPVAALEAPASDFEPTTPREVVHFLIRKIGQGDVEGMKPYLSEAYRKQLEQPGVAAQLKMQGKMLGNAEVEITGVEEAGDEATVEARFEVSMGEQTLKIAMAFTLVKAAGRWVCTEFRPKRG